MANTLRPEEVVTLAHFGEPIANRDLQGIDLSGAPLRGGVFSQVRLVGANLANADLREAFFDHCDLSGCTLQTAQLRGAVFDHCTLDGIQALAASWHAAKLVESSARDARP